MAKKFIFILLFVVIIGYILANLNVPALFIIYFCCSFWLLFFALELLTVNIIWDLVPQTRKIFRNDKKRYRTIVIFCSIFFIIGFWVINNFLLRKSSLSVFHPTRLLTDGIILVFTIFLGWSLISLRKRIFLTSVIAIFLFIFLFAVKGYNTNDHESPSETLKKLAALPYLSHVAYEKDAKKSGVETYNRSLSDNGINLFNSYNVPEAHLVDMNGKVLHTWSTDKSLRRWHYVEIFDGCDLFVIVKDESLLRLNWDSSINWMRKMRAHHDIIINRSYKDIHVLDRKDEMAFYYGLPIPILNDYIVTLSLNGKIKREMSLYQILKKEIPIYSIFKIYGFMIDPYNIFEIMQRKKKKGFYFRFSSPPDIIHSNTIELIDHDLNNVFKKGNILYCSRHLNIVGVIDIIKEKLVWSWGKGNLELPHHPSLLENGNILIFDNGTARRGYSRIIEFDHISEKIEWEYKGNPPDSFFSSWGGANQKLPNGNILITDSTNGRVLEITEYGDIVWEYFNPVKNKEGKRATIYRMMRLVKPEDYSCFSDL